MALAFRGENGGNELMSFGCELADGTRLLLDVIFDKSNNGANVQMRGPNEQILPYFNHALGMIVNL